jgi:homoserine O-acetyltransferase/O-succinyltransferase
MRSFASAALVALLLLLLPVGHARAVQYFNGQDFQFEDGSVLSDFRVAYETQGTLTPAHDNAILLIPGAIGDRHAFDAMIGPGKTFDTDKYFVITADPLGGGESSSPAQGRGQEFPRYTIRDMMEAQQALVTRGLGLKRLRAVVGLSMGSFIALEWAIHHPDTIGSLVLLGPSPKPDTGFRLIVDLVNSVIALDPEWQGGAYTHNPAEGLRHAGMLFYPWTVSSAYIDRISSRQLSQEVEATARAFAQWDANSLVLRYAAYRAHDIAAPFEGDIGAALARVSAPTLVIAGATDRLIGTEGARRISEKIRRASYAEIASDLGHRALRAGPDTAAGEFIDEQIRGFLAKPSEGSR